MAFVHREANWVAHSDTAALKSGDKPRKHGVGERSHHLAQVNHSALRRPPNHLPSAAPCSNSDVESPTIEIVVELAEALGVTTVVVTADPELRAVLAEVLPRDGVVFADSPEQLLSRPVPDNCAVLIVEHSLSRAAFEHLKSHLKADAPALVNIMVGTRDDGSSLVGQLSAGWIDRFMVKPLQPGPTRIALRSALQQHHSLRSRVQVDRAKPGELATEEAIGAARIAQVMPVHGTHDQPPRSAIAAATQQPILQPIPHVPPVIAEKLTAVATERVSARVVKSAPVESARRPAATTQPHGWSLPPPSWGLAFAAIVAVAGLVAWGMSMRAPSVDVNQAMVDKIVAGHLAAAQRALEVGSYVDPPGLSATHFYNAVLELDPANAQAKNGLEVVADRQIAVTELLIASGDLLRAQSTLDNVRRMQPDHRELADVTASLLNAREAERRTILAAKSAPPSNREPTVAVAPLAAAAAPKVVSERSANSEHRVNTGPQRNEPAARADSPAGRKDSAPTKEFSAAAQLVSTADASPTSLNGTVQSANDTQVNEKLVATTPTQTDASKVLAPAQDEPVLRPTPKIAALAATAAYVPPSGASIAGSSSASAISTNPTSPGLRSTDAVSTRPVATSAATTSAVTGDTATGAAAAKSKLIKYVPPVYPFKARGQGIEGWVDVNFTVTSDGGVINPRIENGTLDDRFHRAALAAVTQWKFAPAQNGTRPNRPVNVRLEFKLTD